MGAELLPARPYPSWNRYVVMPVCKFLCRILFWVLGPITPRGAYRVPRRGPVLILSNHLADVDPRSIQTQLASDNPRDVQQFTNQLVLSLRAGMHCRQGGVLPCRGRWTRGPQGAGRPAAVLTAVTAAARPRERCDGPDLELARLTKVLVNDANTTAV